jgi:hypothetical protein
MFQYDFFCAATTLVIFSWIALRRRDRRLRLRVLVAVLAALSLLSLCQATARLIPVTYMAKIASLFTPRAAVIASGHPVVDGLLRDYEQGGQTRVDFPILVESTAVFARNFFQDTAPSLILERLIAPALRLAGMTPQPPPDERQALTAVGVCIFRANGARVIFLDRDYVQAQDERHVAKLLAHEISHCVLGAPHDEDPGSLMAEDIDASEPPDHLHSIKDFLDHEAARRSAAGR